MSRKDRMIGVYLEVGSKRTVASAVEWPGWSRIGKHEASALEALAAYGVRYGRIAHAAHINFKSPADSSAFEIVKRLQGGAMTDFGAIESIPSIDNEPLSATELQRSQALLRAAWYAFDAAVAAAQDKTLSTGPRGGGRDLDHIVEHVIGVDASHLSRLGRKYKPDEKEELAQQLADLREAVIGALEASVQGEIPERGPRGGKRIPARFFVRRSLWHTLDHVWEIEDRSTSDDNS